MHVFPGVLVGLAKCSTALRFPTTERPRRNGEQDCRVDDKLREKPNATRTDRTTQRRQTLRPPQRRKVYDPADGCRPLTSSRSALESQAGREKGRWGPRRPARVRPPITEAA